MTLVEFSASIIDSIAWPAAIVVTLVIFRAGVRALLQSITRISHGATQISFQSNPQPASYKAGDAADSLAGAAVKEPGFDVTAPTLARDFYPEAIATRAIIATLLAATTGKEKNSQDALGRLQQYAISGLQNADMSHLPSPEQTRDAAIDVVRRTFGQLTPAQKP